MIDSALTGAKNVMCGIEVLCASSMNDCSSSVHLQDCIGGSGICGN